MALLITNELLHECATWALQYSVRTEQTILLRTDALVCYIILQQAQQRAESLLPDGGEREPLGRKNPVRKAYSFRSTE